MGQNKVGIKGGNIEKILRDLQMNKSSLQWMLTMHLWFVTLHTSQLTGLQRPDIIILFCHFFSKPMLEVVQVSDVV